MSIENRSGFYKKMLTLALPIALQQLLTSCAQLIDTAMVVGLGNAGSAASELSSLCTVCIRLPEDETFKVQELTLPVYHALCAMTEATYFKN